MNWRISNEGDFYTLAGLLDHFLSLRDWYVSKEKPTQYEKGKRDAYELIVECLTQTLDLGETPRSGTPEQDFFKKITNQVIQQWRDSRPPAEVKPLTPCSVPFVSDEKLKELDEELKELEAIDNKQTSCPHSHDLRLIAEDGCEHCGFYAK